jgi:GH24 family phage-related lysozyme (muramidase)
VSTRTYPMEDGRWVVADGDFWLPGNYDAEVTARAAVELTNVQLEQLEKRICWETTGEGRAITMADLKEQA